MGSRSTFLVLIVMVSIILLSACATPEAAPQIQFSPEPLKPTEIAPEEDQDDEDIERPTLDDFLTPLLEALVQTPPDYATLQSVMGDEFWILDPTPSPILTLFICCAEDGNPSPTFHPPYRYVVRATLSR